ncbi:cell division protein FtsA [Patescibacteria group bacterium]|nr:cell division protein FtsA [Patescibacteria group bacterium]
MKRKKIITGIDLGSGTIRVAVGEVSETGRLNIIKLAVGPSDGIKKGIISSVEDTVSSISACIESVENKIGVEIDNAYVGISGNHIISQPGTGVVGISHPDGKITKENIEDVLRQAEKSNMPANYKILHTLPRSYSVENQVGISNPMGMTGARLEVDTEIILGLSNQIKYIYECFLRTGINVNKLIFSILSTSDIALTKKQKDLGVLLINLGQSTTSISVFEDEEILTAKVIPIGSQHITNDIALGMRVSPELAEKIKVNYGKANANKVRKGEKVNLQEIDIKEDQSFSMKELSKIIDARCEEIFELVNNELEQIDKKGKLPAGAVLTGAGINLINIADIAKSVLKIPVSFGKLHGFEGKIDDKYKPGFSTAVGLVAWGFKHKRNVKKAKSWINFSLSRIKNLYKDLFFS